MKQYVITELSPEESEAISAYLKEKVGFSGIIDFFWIPVDPGLYTKEQETHIDCAPLCFSVEMDVDQLICEFLLRTRKKVACDCIKYATAKQREWIIEFLDEMLNQLNIHP